MSAVEVVGSLADGKGYLGVEVVSSFELVALAFDFFGLGKRVPYLNLLIIPSLSLVKPFCLT